MEPSGESNAMARKTITDLPIFKLSQHANNDGHLQKLASLPNTIAHFGTKSLQFIAEDNQNRITNISRNASS